MEIANATVKEGRLDQGIKLYDQILCTWACNPSAVAQAASAVCLKDFPGIAVALNTLALQMSGNSPDIMANLAASLRQAHRYDDAIAVGEKCLAAVTDDDKSLLATIYSNLCGAYVNLGQPWKGIPHGKRALAFEKETGVDNPSSENNLGLLLLEAGQWKAGWHHWARRFDVNAKSRRNYAGELWDGRPVGSLVIHGEQGIGDEIMFLACMADVLPLVSGRAVLEVTKKIKSLVERSFPDCEVITKPEELDGDCEAWVPMGNLPGLFRDGVPPKRSGYIVPQPALVEYWRDRVGDSYLLAFRGGVFHTHAGIRNPSLDMWKPVVDALPGRLYSIQYGVDGASSADTLGIPHLEEAASDLEQQAACIAASAGLISVQQTALHLAGALGRPCLGVIASRPAWRYGVSGSMPWYQAVELIRAQDKDGWPAVMQQIANKVKRAHL